MGLENYDEMGELQPVGGDRICLDETNVRTDGIDDGKEILGFRSVNADGEIRLFALHCLKK